MIFQLEKVVVVLTFVSSLVLLSGCGGSGGDFEYVAIGASDATGVGAFPPTAGYAFKIEDGLDEECRETVLYNLGIPGAEADEIENVEIPAAVEIDPNVITIWVGPNDLVAGRSVESFRSDLIDILMTLSVDTQATLFVANLPNLVNLPRFQDDPDPDVTLERVQAYNVVIASEARESGAILVDLFAIPLSDVLVSEDGFHPSNEGHARISQIFLDQILPISCEQFM